ncbi:uncharacterized protein TNCV_4439581 [Trichonephila clavipes]|nr:uncharacterized protein TNCV_4439581 [Trichonephila clavipes]
MVQKRRQITENTKQHYMSQYKMDTIRTIGGNKNAKQGRHPNQRPTARRNGEIVARTTRIFKKRCKKNIETLQSENRKTYNRRRKKASLYKECDLVAIQRTQFGAGLKLRPKFLGPYKVTKVNSKDRYEVEKGWSARRTELNHHLS